LESEQQDMTMKLASAERELAQLRSSTRKTEFELLGRQQEVNAQLDAAKKQLAEAQAKAVEASKKAATDGSAAKDQFNKVSKHKYQPCVSSVVHKETACHITLRCLP
jgi:ABC-type Fe3+-citrate transport system substrate-binding protein